MFSKFFINRPRFAAVISLVLVFAGAMAMRTLPIEEYPNITPPQIYIHCNYTGAGSEVVRDTVATVIENELNGVDGIMYFNSNCDNNGSYFCIISFESGTDEDMAQVKVQNAIKRAEPRLPQEVTRRGVNIFKRSNDILCMYAFTTDGSNMSKKDLSNYLANSVKDTLQRVDGVSSVDIMGGEAYSMRIWLDPLRMGALGISPADISAAVAAQNIQAVSGTIGSEGGNDYLQMKVDTLGRLSSTEQFENIVVRTGGDGSIVLLKDVTTIELGASSYSTFGEYNGEEAVMLAVYRDSSSNALGVMDRVSECLSVIKARLPKGVDFKLGYDPTEFIRVSMKEIGSTLVIALVLVVLITYLFLQNIRATLVPIVAIPVSLMATFPVMAALGFSVNTLTMFGLILVIGSLVDDAIVVVEGTVSLMEREHLSARDAALKCMTQVTGAVIATTLVTLACYLPLAYYGGIVGTIYKQFAVTMCVSLCFSTLVALTLSPAMCALFLKPTSGKVPLLLKPVDVVIGASRKSYMFFVKGLVRRGFVTLLLLACVMGGIYVSTKGLSLPGKDGKPGKVLVESFKSAFLTQEDKGVILCNVELPPGSSLERTTRAIQEFRRQVNEELSDAVSTTLNITGFGFLSGAGEHSGMLIIDLKHWDERKDPSLSAQSVLQRVQGIAMRQVDANVVCFTPPAIQGLGATGGISGYLCGEGVSVEELGEKVQEFCRTMTADPDCMYAMTTFTANSPQVYLDIDRQKALQLGLSMSDISFALQSGLGSYYINDFTYRTESFYVQMQNDRSLRGDVEDLMNLQIVSSKTGEIVPLSSVATYRYTTGSRALQRFNKSTAAQINIQTMPGVPSISVMNKIEKMDLGKDFHVEWTDLSFHEKRNNGKIVTLFAMAILFAYLFLVAQYESWTIPVPVMLTVATATLGAIVGARIAHMDMNIYVQLGLVMLIGLTAKNAILMVEFSKQERDHGVEIAEAALNGASLRYRAVLMTAWSFVFGVFPLVVANGAGAGSRRAIGVPTFSGMLVATFLGIILTPALYAVFQRIREAIKHKLHIKTAAEKYLEEHAAGIAKMSVAFFAVCSAATFLSGCSTICEARRAQRGEEMLFGERAMTFAESGIDIAKPVALTNLEAIALQASPAVFQARQAVVLARLAVKDIDSSLIPSVDANGGYTLQTSNRAPATETDWSMDGSWNVGLGLNWLVYDFGRTRASSRAAIRKLAAAECAARATEVGVAYGVRSAVFGLLRTKSMSAVADETAASYAEHLRQMKDRYEVGAVNSYSVTKAGVDAANAELGAVTASNAVLTAKANLDLALGLADSVDFALGDIAVVVYDDFTVEDLMRIARTNSPALASARASAEGARYAVDKAVADLYPSLGVSIKLTGTDDGNLLWNLVGAGSLAESVFSAGRNKRAIDAAVANLRIARSKALDEELKLASEVKVAVLDSNKAKRQLEVAEKKERLAKENFDIVDERYKAGKASELERTDAQVSLSSAKAAVVAARFDWYGAQILISKLLGL